MRISLIPILTILFLVASCNASEKQAETPSPAEMVAGKWWMNTVLDSGNDVTKEEPFNPEGNRWIEFKADGSYNSDGDPYGPNTGNWKLMGSGDSLEIFLDSDAGEGDDSYWLLSFEEEQMRWKGSRSSFTERFEIIYRPD